MSHFTVLVIGEDYETQLAPYHEFECTGLVDEYVQTIDETEEYRARWESDTKTMARLPGGSFAKYVRDETGRPALRTGAPPDLHGEHKYGWVEVDADGEVVAVVDRTNPNAHWDWYAVGGRWTGYFPLKSGTRGEVGRPGLMTPPARRGYADQCRWGDVDFARARQEEADKAYERWADWQQVLDTHGAPEAWASVLERMGEEEIDAARLFWRSQPAVRAMQEKRYYTCPIAAFGLDRGAYVQRATARALVPFAIVKDGQWHEKGSMGWFGVVLDEKDQADWNEQVAALLTDLPPDTVVTLVDCHI